ncbi:hypothetical protein DERP_010619, partial [Dermatophagoides pteronyssinus]
NRFPLNELVNVIAQAAINGDIPFNKVDLNKPFKMQQLQIPILLLRPEDIYKASGSNNINFKLITAQPIRIPIYDEPINNQNQNQNRYHQNNQNQQQRRPSIHNRQRQRDYNQFNQYHRHQMMTNVGRQMMNFNNNNRPQQQQQQPTATTIYATIKLYG